jgi:hypothetical protein
MNTIIVIAVVLVIGWYGNLLYKQHGLAFMQNLTADFESVELVKCITKVVKFSMGTLLKGFYVKGWSQLKVH